MQNDRPGRRGVGSDEREQTDGGGFVASSSTTSNSSVSSRSDEHLRSVRSLVASRRSRQYDNNGGRARSRHFVFTWNNYPQDVRQQLESLSPAWCIYQGERGSGTGTRHLQGALSFHNARTFSSIARKFRGWHIEIMRGTIEQSVEYCTKEETRDPEFGEPVEFGARPRNVGRAGGRSDIDAVADSIAQGSGVVEVAESFGGEFIKYHRGIERLIGLRFPNRDFKTEVRWYWGPTGTGKTRAACNEAVDPYWKNPAHRWWDGYEGQKDVVIDDIRCDFAKFSEWLRLFDRYPVQVEVKGGTRNFISKRIFITAPLPPEEMWQSRTAEDLNQLRRRIEVVKYFGDHAFNPENNDSTN